MKLIKILILSLTTQAAFAGTDPLEFRARIKNELLAEEAIDLLHCLSDRLEIPWELGEGGKASHRLSLTEVGGGLEGVLVLPKGETKFSLGQGESQAVCEKILPEENSEEAEMEDEPDFPSASPAGPAKNWVWGVAAAAALVGGFLFWKSRQPDHRSLRME